MSNAIYRYVFGEEIPMDQAGETLLLAALAVECLQGRSGIRLDAVFDLDPKTRQCTINTDTEVGQQIARIFTGFLAREFGEQTFQVARGAMIGEASS